LHSQAPCHPKRRLKQRWIDLRINEEKKGWGPFDTGPRGSDAPRNPANAGPSGPRNDPPGLRAFANARYSRFAATLNDFADVTELCLAQWPKDDESAKSFNRMAALGQRIMLGPRHDARSVAKDPRYLLPETPNESTMH